MGALARILVIAGSDSGGGAGIQADSKTIGFLGGYATNAMTAITAQNTTGVQGVFPVPAAFVAAQIKSVLSDIGADAIKTGMLFSADIIEAVARAIADCPAPLVLDPVMVAKGGAHLLQPDAVEALVQHLLPRATLLTPNIPEAELLADISIHTEDDMRRAAEIIIKRGARAVLMKGGHLDGAQCVDMLMANDGTMQRWQSPRQLTANTHGTGCTLASAIACGLGQGMALPDAITRAHDYLQRAIAAAPTTIGHGHGPVGHGWVLSA